MQQMDTIDFSEIGHDAAGKYLATDATINNFLEDFDQPNNHNNNYQHNIHYPFNQHHSQQM